jgi:hypothetical protein
MMQIIKKHRIRRLHFFSGFSFSELIFYKVSLEPPAAERTRSEPQNGAAKENIHIHFEVITSRTGPILGKQVHINLPDPPSKSEPILPKICPVPSHLRPDPLVFHIKKDSRLPSHDVHGR